MFTSEVFLSFIISILGAVSAYYLYFTVLTGLNLFLRIVFSLPVIALISINIFLIIKEKHTRKRIAFALIMLVCFAVSVFVVRDKVDQFNKGGGIPRRYTVPHKV